MIHQEPPTSPSSDQLALLLVAAGQVPVHRELMDRHTDHWLPDPDRGQLWRLEHAGTAALAVVWSASAATVSVMPVSEDPSFGDAHTVVFTETPLQVAIGVWPSLEASIPTWVLDRCLGQLDPGPLIESRLAFRTQQQTSASPPPPDRAWSDLSRFREQLADRLEPFIALTWADERPVVDGAAALDDLLRSRGHRLRWLASRLGIVEPDVALLVWQGRKPLDDREASVLAAELNVDAGDLQRISRNVPIELSTETSHPRLRPQVQRWAVKNALSEMDARDQIEERIMAVAARSAGDDSEKWRTLLEHFFTEELGTP